MGPLWSFIRSCQWGDGSAGADFPKRFYTGVGFLCPLDLVIYGQMVICIYEERDRRYLAQQQPAPSVGLCLCLLLLCLPGPLLVHNGLHRSLYVEGLSSAVWTVPSSSVTLLQQQQASSASL